MAVLPVQTLPLNGSLADLVYTAVDAGLTDTFVNDGKTIAIVKNGDAGGHTCTPTVVKDSGAMIAETGAAITIGASKESVLGPFDRATYNGPASGAVSLVFDSDTSMSVAIISLP